MIDADTAMQAQSKKTDLGRYQGANARPFQWYVAIVVVRL
jgi:hypothetical protein